MADRVYNVYPDIPDLRDRVYVPTLRALERAYNPRPFEDGASIERVRNQESTSACTGFALAGLVDSLAYRAWLDHRQQWPRLRPTSPFMLYYMARRYDEIPGDDVSVGSTARGAMKAWHKHGACGSTIWSSIDQDPAQLDPSWISDAFAAPLGAYYRVDCGSIPDLHAAINETGVVYVTASIHSGWYSTTPEGDIKTEGATTVGGHAFLLVGYDEQGFWIQNSWGPEWGVKGFARLTYADWRDNAMDAWVAQLGVQVSAAIDGLTSGLIYSAPAQAAADGAPVAGGVAVSSDPSISAQQINPYVVNLENNGTLSDRGQFQTREVDLELLVTRYLGQAVHQWGLSDTDPIDVAVYAHGGLTPESGAADTARRWVPALYSWRVFPIFLMWETGLVDTVRDLVDDALRGVPSSGPMARLWDSLMDRLDDRIESLVSPVGTPIWDEMKQNAAFATTNPHGGLRQLYAKFADAVAAKPGLRERLRFHLIGHSAGAIFHAHLIDAIVQAGLRVDGVYFMAPACTTKLFKEKVLPHFESGKVAAYTQFHLADPIEKRDTVASTYHKSLLYMVSNAFEHGRQVPILGMEKYVKADAAIATAPTAAHGWDFVVAPTLVEPADSGMCSMSLTHGGFDDDAATQHAVLTRIARRRTASLPGPPPGPLAQGALAQGDGASLAITSP